MKTPPAPASQASCPAPLGLAIGILQFAGLLACAQPVGLELQFYPSLHITGAVGTVHSIHYTTNLASPDWKFLTFLQLTNNPHLHVDTAAPRSEQRFYRSTSIAPTSFEQLQLLPATEQRFFRLAMGIPEMVQINSGAFIMGSPTAETGRGSDEGPQTRVVVSICGQKQPGVCG